MPAYAVWIIIFMFLLIFLQMVEDFVYNSSNAPGIFTDFFKSLHVLFFLGHIVFFYHFKMITEQKYLKIVSLEYIRTKIYFRAQKTVGGSPKGPHCIPRKLSPLPANSKSLPGANIYKLQSLNRHWRQNKFKYQKPLSILTKAHVTESIARKNKVSFWMLDLTAFEI